LVFLREGGGGGLRRWSFRTPPVEAPTVDIVSSSLNGFSLRVFSRSGPPKLAIFAVLKVSFRRFGYEQVVQNDLRNEAREKSMSEGVLCPVRCSEAIERNEIYESVFSNLLQACLRIWLSRICF